MMKAAYVHLLFGLFYLVGASFLPISSFEPKALGIAFCMIHWWIAQPVPIYVTALVPLIVGVPLGMISETELASAYGNKMVFLFLGGFLIALGIEKWKLHHYFAEYILNLFGNSPKQILLGFMVSTAALSMWISNTATALMMLPMAISIILSIPRFRLKKRFSIALLLSIAFSANIGGIATLIGTPPNVQMAGILEQNFQIEITFWQWFKFGFPFMLLLLIVTYFILRLVFLKNISFEVNTAKSQKMNTPQKRVLVVFLITVIFWIFSVPIFKPLGIPINDTMIALFGGFLLFIVPQENKKPLLEWNDTKRLPWGILLLFGGGLALAKMLANGNVVIYAVESLSSFSHLPLIVIMFLFFGLALFATELMSNLALVSILIPVLGEFAVLYDLPLITLAAGVAISASCAFMLPIATPPNAIVYSANILSMSVMVRVGFIVNCITLVLTTLFLYFFHV